MIKRSLSLWICFAIGFLPARLVLADSPHCSAKHNQLAELRTICEKGFKNGCADVKESMRRTCRADDLINPGAVVWGCINGLKMSLYDMGNLIVKVVKALVQTEIGALDFVFAVNTGIGNATTAQQNLRKLTSGTSMSLSSLSMYLQREYVSERKKSFLPGEIGDAEAFAKLGPKIMGPLFVQAFGKIGEFLASQLHHLDCYNAHERARMTCEVLSDFLIPPAGLIGILKGAGKGLLKNPKILEAIAKVAKLERLGLEAESSTVVSRTVHAARAEAIAARNGKTVAEMVSANAKLTDAERAKKIAENFPHLKQNRINEKIVTAVHSIGSEREGAGVYNYTTQEIAAKARKLKELGVDAADRAALLQLGYAGQNASEFEKVLKQTEAVGSGLAPPQSIPKTKGDLQLEIVSAQREVATQQAARDPLAALAAEKRAQLAAQDLKWVQGSEQQMIGKTELEKILAQPVRIAESQPTRELVNSRNFVADKLSAEKVKQIGSLYKDDPLAQILDRPVRGQAVEFEDKSKLVIGQLLRVDPKNPENFTVLITDSQRGRRIVSLKQTQVAVSVRERTALQSKVTEEMAASGATAENFKLILNAQRTPAVSTVPGLSHTTTADKFVERIVKDAASPYVAEARRLEAQQERVAKFSPEWFDLQHKISKVLRPVSPLTTAESDLFEGLKFVPTDAHQFSPAEWNYLSKLDAIRKSRNVAGYPVRDGDPEFQQLQKILNTPNANLTSQVTQLDRSWAQLTKGEVSYSSRQFRIPAEVAADLRKVSPLRDEVAKKIEILFGTPPSELKNGAAAQEYESLRQFFAQPKIKQALPSERSLRYLNERFKMYEAAKDLDRAQVTGSKPSGWQYERIYGTPLPPIEGVR